MYVDTSLLFEDLLLLSIVSAELTQVRDMSVELRLWTLRGDIHTKAFFTGVLGKFSICLPSVVRKNLGSTLTLSNYGSCP